MTQSAPLFRSRVDIPPRLSDDSLNTMAFTSPIESFVNKSPVIPTTSTGTSGGASGGPTVVSVDTVAPTISAAGLVDVTVLAPDFAGADGEHVVINFDLDLTDEIWSTTSDPAVDVILPYAPGASTSALVNLKVGVSGRYAGTSYLFLRLWSDESAVGNLTVRRPGDALSERQLVDVQIRPHGVGAWRILSASLPPAPTDRMTSVFLAGASDSGAVIPTTEEVLFGGTDTIAVTQSDLPTENGVLIFSSSSNVIGVFSSDTLICGIVSDIASPVLTVVASATGLAEGPSDLDPIPDFHVYVPDVTTWGASDGVLLDVPVYVGVIALGASSLLFDEFSEPPLGSPYLQVRVAYTSDLDSETMIGKRMYHAGLGGPNATVTGVYNDMSTNLYFTLDVMPSDIAHTASDYDAGLGFLFAQSDTGTMRVMSQYSGRIFTALSFPGADASGIQAGDIIRHVSGAEGAGDFMVLDQAVSPNNGEGVLGPLAVPVLYLGTSDGFNSGAGPGQVSAAYPSIGSPTVDLRGLGAWNDGTTDLDVFFTAMLSELYNGDFSASISVILPALSQAVLEGRKIVIHVTIPSGALPNTVESLMLAILDSAGNPVTSDVELVPSGGVALAYERLFVLTLAVQGGAWRLMSKSTPPAVPA